VHHSARKGSTCDMKTWASCQSPPAIVEMLSDASTKASTASW
jgi:hypothetical protein